MAAEALEYRMDVPPAARWRLYLCGTGEVLVQVATRPVGGRRWLQAVFRGGRGGGDE